MRFDHRRLRLAHRALLIAAVTASFLAFPARGVLATSSDATHFADFASLLISAAMASADDAVVTNSADPTSDPTSDSPPPAVPAHITTSVQAPTGQAHVQDGPSEVEDGIACPIPSGSEFIDSWGAGRSGGRRHEGVDMIADRGMPVVAAQSGDVSFKQNRLGGNAAWLYSPHGDTFYYAHLDAFEGGSRTVVRGDVIGYVGSTGNAQGPHLHFETHFGGAVGNPYPATAEACTRAALEAEQAAAEARAIHGTFEVSSRTTVVRDADRTPPGDLDLR